MSSLSHRASKDKCRIETQSFGLSKFKSCQSALCLDCPQYPRGLALTYLQPPLPSTALSSDVALCWVTRVSLSSQAPVQQRPHKRPVSDSTVKSVGDQSRRWFILFNNVLQITQLKQQKFLFSELGRLRSSSSRCRQGIFHSETPFFLAFEWPPCGCVFTWLLCSHMRRERKQIFWCLFSQGH